MLEQQLEEHALVFAQEVAVREHVPGLQRTAAHNNCHKVSVTEEVCVVGGGGGAYVLLKASGSLS